MDPDDPQSGVGIWLQFGKENASHGK